MTKPNKALRDAVEKALGRADYQSIRMMTLREVAEAIATHGPAHGIGVLSDEAREAYEELKKTWAGMSIDVNLQNARYSVSQSSMVCLYGLISKILALGPQPSQPATAFAKISEGLNEALAVSKGEGTYTPEKPARKMVQWEYNSLYDDLETDDAHEFHRLKMNDLGKDGWEAYAIHNSRSGITAYFKRPVSQETAP